MFTSREMTGKAALVAAGLSAGLLAGSATAAGEDWYLSGRLNQVQSDSDRIDDDAGAAFAGIGWYINDKFGVELEYGGYEFKIPTGKIDIDGFDLAGRYYFRGNREASPFLGLGLGRFDSDSPHGSGSDSVIDAIGGYHWPLSDRIAATAEIRYRFDSDDDAVPGADDFQDWMFGVGVNVAFGPRYGKPTAPQPEQMPASKPKPADSDRDGVPDDRDRCPSTPRGAEVDANGCPLDSDQDKVPDHRDNCPDTARGNLVDEDGCDKELVIRLEGVHFDFDKATLKPAARVKLDEAIETLKAHQRIRVEVAGHTDSQGTEAYNQGLSERRANTVRDYLTVGGIAADRLVVRGYGETQPIAPNDTDAGRAENRRVDLKVLNNQ